MTASVPWLPRVEATTPVRPLAEGRGGLCRGRRLASSPPPLETFSPSLPCWARASRRWGSSGRTASAGRGGADGGVGGEAATQRGEGVEQPLGVAADLGDGAGAADVEGGILAALLDEAAHSGLGGED